MVWALYAGGITDAAEIESAFVQSGLTGGEWNRIKDYVSAWMAAKVNAPIIPPEHPCYLTDGPNWFDPIKRSWVPVEGGTLENGPWVPNPNPMRVYVINHGTRAGWLAEMQRLLQRPQRDRQILQPYYDFISQSPWYAVENYPPPAGYFDGMTCT